MSAFVLDTSVLIALEALDFTAYRDGTLLLSSTTVGELAFGLGLGDAAEHAARAARFRYALAEFEILTFGVEEAKLYGALAGLVRAAGRNPRPRRPDLQIAATAAAARLPLLTCNPADFADLDPLVEVVAIG